MGLNIEGVQYIGIAVFPDGREIKTSGTIQEMANWADNLIRASGCDLKIEIVKDKAAVNHE